ncbi:hypothetical protein [Mucilaginibacter lappiensis]|uniref:Uncharacterized protein n=1 Tax=Mucilaginibacter lappiensis TaxID=354630 RepID=A0A841J8V0_9SPHI|nr:hypothetical protein [Mucilaginibacter lappiensis]MBB6127190.1 hypothetical protein [Mucilaginibacter lappiensis]
MNRFYFDSNIFRALNPASNQYIKAVDEIARAMQRRYIFYYSDAHLDDLKSSREDKRDIDFGIIGEMTGNLYAKNDFKHRCQWDVIAPSAAFRDKNYETVDEFIKSPEKIDLLFDAFKDLDIPGMDGLRVSFDVFLNAPINLPHRTDEAKDEMAEVWREKILPGYDKVTMVRNFMESIFANLDVFTENKDEFTAFRTYVRTTIASEQFSFEKYKLDFDLRFKDSPFNRTFMEVIENMLVNDQKNDLYLRCLYMHHLIELYGVSSDKKAGGGMKKMTFNNATADAAHIYYASFGDYLVTDDTGMQVKAYIMYSLLKLPVKILTSTEFAVLGAPLGEPADDFDIFKAKLTADVPLAEELLFGHVLPENEANTYVLPLPYLDYFTQMQGSDIGDHRFYVLFNLRHSHADLVLLPELQMVTDHLLSVFGVDDEHKGAFDLEEPVKDEPHVRKWSFGRVEYFLGVHFSGPACFIRLVVHVLRAG